MKYAKGSVGRVFVLNIEHGDDLLEGIKKVIAMEDVSFATVSFIGAVSSGDIVVGPKGMELPADPNTIALDGVWEMTGSGTAVKGKQEPELHLHASFGKGERTLTGCARKDLKVFITAEVVITETVGFNPDRSLDDVTGCRTLHFRD